MLTFIKYLPKILFGFRDVSDTYRSETGEGRPWYLSRTFVFSLLCFLSTVATLVFGIQFDEATIKQIAENTVTVITAVIAIVGAVMSFIAQVRSKRNG